MHRGRLHGRSRLTSILRAPGSLYPPAVYPPDTTLTHPAVNADARPGYLAEITDSTWGTKVRRISNAHLWRNNYSIHQSWNLDGTRIMFPGYGQRILDGDTYADLGAMTSWSDYPNWSNLHADYAYGVKYGDNRLRRFSATGNAWSDYHTFAGYTELDWGGYAGNLADDDRVALITNNAGSYGIMVYDIENDSIIATMGVTGGSPIGCQISRSGAYVVVNYATNGSGTYQGTKLYNAADLSLVRAVSVGRPHQDMGRDAADADIYVFITDDADPGGCCTVKAHRCSDGTETTLYTYGQSIYGIGHISCANYERPGWAYLSCNDIELTSWNGFGQVVAVKTDGSQTTEVFGFTHSTADPNLYYDAAPMASVSRDGTRVIWGSNWGGIPTSEVYCFVAGVTT